jgi:hypothetical protein
LVNELYKNIKITIQNSAEIKENITTENSILFPSNHNHGHNSLSGVKLSDEVAPYFTVCLMCHKGFLSIQLSSTCGIQANFTTPCGCISVSHIILITPLSIHNLKPFQTTPPFHIYYHSLFPQVKAAHTIQDKSANRLAPRCFILYTMFSFWRSEVYAYSSLCIFKFVNSEVMHNALLNSFKSIIRYAALVILVQMNQLGHT